MYFIKIKYRHSPHTIDPRKYTEVNVHATRPMEEVWEVQKVEEAYKILIELRNQRSSLEDYGCYENIEDAVV